MRCRLQNKGFQKTEIKNYKLITVAENFHLDDGISFHDSMEDTHVTFLIFNILSQELLEEEEKF